MSMAARFEKHIRIYVCAIMAMAIIAANAVALAAQPIWIEINQSYLYQAGYSPITRVTVANPAIADVVVLDRTKLNIVGKALGSTSLSVWSDNGMRQDFVVSVCNTDTATAQFIKQSMGLDGVQVAKVGDKLVLQGVVENQYEMNNAMGIAKVYSSEDNIVNLIQMKNPTMVNLAALVIDINNTDERDLGIKYANHAGIDEGAHTITFGNVGEFYGGKTVYDLTGHPFMDVNFMIQALEKNGKIRVLSRPNITTLSGEEAEILIGGELPIPTSKDGEISVEWKPYGIRLNIKPTVDHENKITSTVQAEVSGINNAVAVSTTAGKIPGLTSRKANTVLTVPTGQTMAIGGLMNSDESKVISKIPLLGDIPIIGEFFKHTSTSKDKRELMILITPTIVNSNDPVKGSERMFNTLDEHKRELEDMKDIYPSDPATREPVEKKQSRVEKAQAEIDAEKANQPAKAATKPVEEKQADAAVEAEAKADKAAVADAGEQADQPKKQSWIEKAQAEIDAEKAAKEKAEKEAAIKAVEVAERPVLPEAD